MLDDRHLVALVERVDRQPAELVRPVEQADEAVADEPPFAVDAGARPLEGQASGRVDAARRDPTCGPP